MYNLQFLGFGGFSVYIDRKTNLNLTKECDCMKGLHKFLKVFIWVQLGACSGRVLQKYLDFVNHPEVYAHYSAPWYTGITITVILTAITVLITTAAYFVVGHIIKKREQNETD